MKVEKWVDWSLYENNYVGLLERYASDSFDVGMRWQDLLNLYPENISIYLEALRENVIDNNIRLTGVQHQFEQKGVPMFEDGTALCLSQNDWAGVMAAIWSERENKDYSYQDWYGI